jgi:hypothetical protein
MLARVGLRPLIEPYGDAVPCVHKRDGVGNVGNLLTRNVAPVAHMARREHA